MTRCDDCHADLEIIVVGSTPGRALIVTRCPACDRTFRLADDGELAVVRTRPDIVAELTARRFVVARRSR